MDLTMFPKEPKVGELIRIDGNASRAYMWNGTTWTALKKPFVERRSSDDNPNQGRMGLHKKMAKDILNEEPTIDRSSLTNIAILENSPIKGTEFIYMNGQLITDDDYDIIDNTIYFKFDILENFNFICNYVTHKYTEVLNEKPVGEVNGVNKSFTLFSTPVPNSESVFIDGIKLYSGNEGNYEIINNILHFFSAPSDKNNIIVNYHAIL